MKVLVTNYTFSASAKTVTFADYNPVSLASILLITNVTRDVIIYKFSDPAFGGTVATNVLTLTYNTAAMADADKLQIWYEDTSISVATSGKQDTTNTEIGGLTEAAPATDTASSGLNGRLQRAAQRLTSILTALGSPFQAGGSIGNTSFAATQGTATSLKTQAESYQGGTAVGSGNPLQVTLANTGANATAVKVDGSAATQPISAASLPLPTGAATASKQPALGTAGTASADVITVQGKTAMTPLLVDPSGVISPVSLASVPSHPVTNAGTFAVQSTPVTQADTFMLGGVNIKEINAITPLMGNGVTGTGSQRVTIASDNTAFSIKVQDGSGNAITSAARGSERAVTVQVVDASGTQITSFGGSGGTASNFGSAIPSAGTASGFSDGTNMQLGRVFDIDTGAGTQYGLGANLRISASGGSIEAKGSQTSANSIPVVIASDQGAVSVSLAANQSVNVAQMNGVTVSMGTGVMGTGVQRVAIASDNDALTVKQGTAANLNATVVGTGTFAVQATPVTQTDTFMLGGVNIKEINAVTPLMGNGVTGTGSQRVTIASDNTAFSVNATLSAETTKVIGTVRQLGNGGAVLDAVNTAATAPANGMLTLGIYNSTEPSPTTGQSVGVQLDSKGRTRQVLMDAAGNTRGANVNASNQLSVSVDNTVTVGSHAVTNAGTFAVQATLQASSGVDIGKLTANQSVNVAQMNGVTVLMGNGVTGTGSQRVTIASDNTPFAVKTDQTTHGTTDLVAADITKIAGTSIVTGGTAGTQSVGGIVANNGTINSAVNPILVGGQAVSSENAANTTAKLSQFVTDLVGKQIVLPYANPENFVSGAITSAMTGTTSTSLVAAPAAGLRNYITTIIVSNSHATVGTDVIIQDGSGGTTLLTIPAAAVYGGAVITLPVPLRQPTTATALFCANVTTGASVKISAVGYKGI